MVSLVICVLSALNKYFGKSFTYYTHSLNLPFPQVLHRYLDSTFLQKYEEIFIIGDVHGCYDELLLLLEKADALKDTTLKILVGDIVNKGPKSLEVLNFVKESSSVLSVRGNHDEIVLKEYLNSKESGYKLKPKNSWIKNLSQESAQYLQELPFTICIPSLDTIIVHAGFIPGKYFEDNNPYDMVNIRNVVEMDYFWDGGFRGTKCISEGEPWASLWKGPEHVYFGHDAQRMLQTYPFATGLDTGCVYGNWLTGLFIYGPRKYTFVKVKALKVYEEPKGHNDTRNKL